MQHHTNVVLKRSRPEHSNTTGLVANLGLRATPGLNRSSFEGVPLLFRPIREHHLDRNREIRRTKQHPPQAGSGNHTLDPIILIKTYCSRQPITDKRYALRNYNLSNHRCQISCLKGGRYSPQAESSGSTCGDITTLDLSNYYVTEQW